MSLSRDEAGAEALYRLGALLLREGEARSAVEELSRMPVLYAGFSNWLAQGYLLQARAFRSLGQTGDASRLYDKVIQDFNGTPYANEAALQVLENLSLMLFQCEFFFFCPTCLAGYVFCYKSKKTVGLWKIQNDGIHRRK